jgi:hypothetical protein
VLHCADILAAVGTVAPFVFRRLPRRLAAFSISQRSPPSTHRKNARQLLGARVPCGRHASWLVGAWIGLASEHVCFWALLDDVVSVPQLDDVLHAVHLVSAHHGELRWVGP